MSSAVVLVACAAISALVLFIVHDTTRQHKTAQTLATAARVALLTQRNQSPPALPHEPVAGFQVVDSNGSVVFTHPHLAGKPRMAHFVPKGAKAGAVICDSSAFRDACVIVAAYKIVRNGVPWIIYAADYDVPWHFDKWLPGRLAAISVFLVMFTAFGTYWAVGRALSPVQAITHKLALITATDLSQRVPVPAFHDEIRQLAEAANQTLDRAELAVEQQRRFASDISHDLRNPLTAMRTEIEAALLHPEETDWPRTGQALVNSLDQIQTMVTDLLQMARLDAGASPILERVDLADLVVHELNRRQRKVEVIHDLTPGVMVIGNRVGLARLLNNLVDNGERHAASMLRVRLYREGDTAVLEVLDDGPGIPREHRELVFDRFTRLDAARQKDSGGTGLGLSIARQIASAHKGKLTIEDSPVGARFVLRLPISGD